MRVIAAHPLARKGRFHRGHSPKAAKSPQGFFAALGSPARRLFTRGASIVLGLGLLHGALARQLEGAPSPPAWIWAGEEGTAGQRVTLRVSFDGAAAVERARLRCAADFCRARLVLNGRTVLTIEDYGPWVDEDIAPRIEPGVNELALLCAASEGPSAVALSLVLTGAAGSSREVITGPGWEARVVAELQLPELAVVPQVPRAVARSAAVVELPSNPSSSLAVVTRSASGATGPL